MSLTSKGGVWLFARMKSSVTKSSTAPVEISVFTDSRLRITPFASRTNSALTEAAFSRGADYYIMKPFDDGLIINQIKNIQKAIDIMIDRENNLK